MRSLTSARPAGIAGRTTRRGHREDSLQESLIQFFRLNVRSCDAILRAVPNGEKRDPVTAARLVGLSATQRDLLPDSEALLPYGLGVLPGGEDLNLLLPQGRTVLIEVKTDAEPNVLAGMKLSKPVKMPKAPKGRQSKAQKRFQEGAERLGHHYRVVRSLEGFVAVLREFGVPMRGVLM